MTTTANPVLAILRDSWDTADPWGSGMSAAWAVASVLYDADPNAVPPVLGYTPGMGGPEVPGRPFADGGHMTAQDVDADTAMVWGWLHQVDPDAVDVSAYESWSWPTDDPTFAVRVSQLVHAGTVLARYLDVVRLAGRAY